MWFKVARDDHDGETNGGDDASPPPRVDKCRPHEVACADQTAPGYGDCGRSEGSSGPSEGGLRYQ